MPTAETENSHVCPSPTRSTPSGAFRTRPGRAPTTNKPLQTVGVTPKGNPAALSHLPALGTLLPLSVDGPLLDVPHKRDCRRWGRGAFRRAPRLRCVQAEAWMRVSVPFFAEKYSTCEQTPFHYPLICGGLGLYPPFGCRERSVQSACAHVSPSCGQRPRSGIAGSRGCSVCCLLVLPVLGRLLWHVEVPRLGVESEL